MSTAIKRETGWTLVTVRERYTAANGLTAWRNSAPFRVNVTVEADFAKLMERLASRAAASKRGIATAMHGAIVVRVTKA